MAKKTQFLTIRRNQTSGDVQTVFGSTSLSIINYMWLQKYGDSYIAFLATKLDIINEATPLGIFNKASEHSPAAFLAEN